MKKKQSVQDWLYKSPEIPRLSPKYLRNRVEELARRSINHSCAVIRIVGLRIAEEILDIILNGGYGKDLSTHSPNAQIVIHEKPCKM